jgi:hypothetical protein
MTARQLRRYPIHWDLACDIQLAIKIYLREGDKLSREYLDLCLKRLESPEYNKYLSHVDLHEDEGIPAPCNRCEQLRQALTEQGLL